MAYIIDNNVLTTLHTAIVPATVSIIVDVPAAPNKSPVSPTAGNIATLTIVDQIVSPTVLEIITYTTATNNGDGTYTLTGVTRGTEGTTAQTFSVNALCFQSLTAATINTLSAIGINTLLQFCGDGSDGDSTLSGPLFLSRDTYYRNLTLQPGAALNTNGYSLYVSGNLDLTAAPVGAIQTLSGSPGANSSGSSGGAGGAGAIGVTVPSGAAGGSGASNGGGATIGSAGLGFVGGVGCLGGVGGRASGTGAANGGAGGQPSVLALDINRPGASLTYTNSTTFSGVPFTAPLGGGCGGGGGGSATAASTAGGGGGGGGCGLIVYAATITTSSSTPAGVIQGGKGGAGGSPSVVGGGAGGGGAGGPTYVGYGNRVGPAVTGAIKNQGGATGTQTTTTAFGRGGSSGPVHLFSLLSGSASLATSQGGGLGTNGVAGLGGVNSVNL